MRSVRAGRATLISDCADVLVLLWAEPKARQFLLLTVAELLWACTILVVGHQSQNCALLSFAFCEIKDVARLSEMLIGFWIGRVAKLNKSTLYTFGHSRFLVLSSFGSGLIVMLGALYSIKASTAQLIAAQGPPGVVVLLVWPCAAIVAHLCTALFLSRDNLSRFQDRINRSACCALLASTMISNTDTAVSSYVVIDALAGLSIGVVTAVSIVPDLVNSAMILLQTIPSATLNRLQKSLREISTFDGVLEIAHVKFWMASADELIGSVHVRVRRDAKEQIVLAQVTNKLAHIVSASNLTVQVLKDDWMSTVSTGTPAIPQRISSPQYASAQNHTYNGPTFSGTPT